MVVYFCKQNTKVHIDLNSGRFLNGYILSYDEDKFMFKDKKIEDNIPIFYNSIKNLEPFVEGGKY